MLKASEMRKMFYNSVDRKKVDNKIKEILVELEGLAKEGRNYVIVSLDTKAEVNYIKNELHPLRYHVDEIDSPLNAYTIMVSFAI